VEVYVEFEDGSTEYYDGVDWVEAKNGNVNITYNPEMDKDTEEFENASIKYVEADFVA
jgi:hypothetical protein